MNLNIVQICGRLTAKPEVRKTASGFDVGSFSVATNRTWKDKDSGQKKSEVEFHSVTAFGRTAEVIAQYFNKGDEIYIQGRLKTNKWDDKNGIKRSRTDIMVDRFDFGQKARGTEGAQPAPAQSEEQASPVEGEDGPGVDINDIPF